jgi:CRP-like cAMP-binding protein
MGCSDEASLASLHAERGDIMHVLENQNQARLLEEIPAFSNCTRSILEEFILLSVLRAHCAAGETLFDETLQDRNLYVIVAGTALLNAGDDVVTVLEPGDFFWGNVSPHPLPISSVVAVTDVEVFVINPNELARLEQVSYRQRESMSIAWSGETEPLPCATTRRSRKKPALIGAHA